MKRSPNATLSSSPDRVKKKWRFWQSHEPSNILESLHLFRSFTNAQKLTAAMERAEAIKNKPVSESERLAECQELNIDHHRHSNIFNQARIFNKSYQGFKRISSTAKSLKSA